MLTKFGMFIHNEQDRLRAKEPRPFLSLFEGLVGGSSLWDNLSKLLPRLESASQFSFKFSSIQDTSALVRSNTNKNPAYLHAQFKTLGLFGVLYVIPIFFRKFHDALLEKQKNPIETICSILLYFPRLLIIGYEISLIFITFFPLRIVNLLINKEPEFLSEAQQKEITTNIKNHFPQGPFTYQSTDTYDDEFKVFVINSINSFSDSMKANQDTTKFDQLINHLMFIDHGLDNGAIKGDYKFDPRLEIISFLCAAGYCGKEYQQKAYELYTNNHITDSEHLDCSTAQASPC